MSSSDGNFAGMTQVTSHSINTRGGFVEYNIKFGSKHPHQTKRRFREFLQLRQDLTPMLGDLLPPLPSRYFNTSPSSRLFTLDNFLSQICEFYAKRSSPPRPSLPLMQFLRISEESFRQEVQHLKTHHAESVQTQIIVGIPTIPPQFEQDILRVKKELLSIANLNLMLSAEWTQVGKKDNWSWFARNTPPTNRVVVGEIKRCPPFAVHQLLLNNDLIKQMEVNIDRIVYLQDVDAHTQVQYFCMKSIMYQACRDVILVRHWSVEEDGRIVHTEFSLKEFPGAPPSGEGKRVRAVLTCGGCVLQATPDGTGTKIWRVNNLDPMLGDNIPAFALKKLNEFSSAMLSANMFALENIAQTRRDLVAQAVQKGPLVNAVGGRVQPGRTAAMKTTNVEEEEDSVRMNTTTTTASPSLAVNYHDQVRFVVVWMALWMVLVLLCR